MNRNEIPRRPNESRGAAAARRADHERRAALRADVYAAVLLCLACVFALTVLRLLSSALPLTGAAALALRALGTMGFVLLPALLGLSGLKGNREGFVPLGALSPAQIRLFALTGALAVFPALLLEQAFSGVVRAFAPGASVAVAAAAPDGALFLPMLLCEALLVPACEELFFRGYLLGALSRGGARFAALISALAFALAHGFGTQTPAYALLGWVFALLTLHAGSLLAAVLAHGCYNGALIAAAYLGLGPLLSGRDMLTCAALTAGTALFCLTLRRAAALPPCRRRARLWDGRALSRREIAPLALAALALAAAQVAARLWGGAVG